MPPMTGRVIAGRYNLQHPIGRGAMGVVWRARDQLLDRDVAVKEVVISALIGADERRNAYQRTLREARTAARLSHPGLVAVYDVAEEDGRPWIVMELVPSQSLDQVLTVERRLPPARACRIGQQLVSALAAAHAAGVLHRDVKPSNVLIAANRAGEGWGERAVLTDFGIAQFEGDPRLTQTGMVMGSPGFTAPERIRGSSATPASDLWSLGATIYAAVEGRGPYEARGGAITTMSAIINEDAPVAPHARQLAPLIAALLRRDPARRPSASAALRMFAEVLPRLPELTEEPERRSPPPTIQSSYVTAPGAPQEQTSLTTAEKAEPSEAAADEVSADEVSAESGADAAHTDGEDGADVAASAEDDVPASASGEADEAGPAAAEPGGDEEQDDKASDTDPGPAAEVAAPTAQLASAKPTQGPAAEEASSQTVAARPRVAATLLDAPPARQDADGQSAEAVVPGHTPGPTFTAKPNERMAPKFSAASPPRPARQVPAQGYPPAQPGRTTPFLSQGARYAGPVHPSPDLGRQYPPGAGGGHAGTGGGKTRRMLWLVLAVIIAAAVGVGTTLALHRGGGGGSASSDSTGGIPTSVPSVADTTTAFASVNALNSPVTAPPDPRWTTYTVTSSDANSAAAGFSIDLPSGWTETRKGLATVFSGPDHMLLEVDLTQQQTTDMVAAAEQVEAASRFPGYRRLDLQAVPVRHAEGSVWKFTWKPAGGVQYLVDDIFFAQQTSAGVQDYAVYVRAPSSTFARTRPLIDEILATFQP